MDKRIGAQLYTVRDYTKTLEEFDRTLEKIAKIGYKAVQLSAIGPFSAEEVKQACDKYHLIPVCTHRSMDEYCNHLEEMIQFHRTIGCSIAGIGAVPNLRNNLSWSDVTEFVTKMNVVSRELRKNGITFAYHNHDVDFELFDGKRPIEYILENGDFDLIADVYWIAAAGIDPARFIKRAGSRIKVAHFKDLAVKKNGEGQKMAEVMEGNLDWDSIIDACEGAGVEWAVVEQDICERDPFECLKCSYQNLTKKGFC